MVQIATIRLMGLSLTIPLSGCLGELELKGESGQQ